MLPIKRSSLWCCLLLFFCGCVNRYRYEVDLSKLKDFKWDKTLRVEQTDHGFFTGWKLTSVEVASTDGRVIHLVPDPKTVVVSMTADPPRSEFAPVHVRTEGYAGGLRLGLWNEDRTITCNAPDAAKPKPTPLKLESDCGDDSTEPTP